MKRQKSYTVVKGWQGQVSWSFSGMTKQGDNGLVMRLTSFLHMTGKSTFTLPSFPYLAWHANGASQKDHPHLSHSLLYILQTTYIVALTHHLPPLSLCLFPCREITYRQISTIYILHLYLCKYLRFYMADENPQSILDLSTITNDILSFFS